MNASADPVTLYTSTKGKYDCYDRSVYTHMDAAKHIIGADLAITIREDQGDHWLTVAVVTEITAMRNPCPICHFFMAWFRLNRGQIEQSEYDAAAATVKAHLYANPELVNSPPSSQEEDNVPQ